MFFIKLLGFSAIVFVLSLFNVGYGLVGGMIMAFVWVIGEEVKRILSSGKD